MPIPLRSTSRAFVSAKQLLWMLIVATASGVALLVPSHLMPSGAAPTWLDPVLRGVHSVSSLFVVVGALVHTGIRLAKSSVSLHTFLSGYAGSIAVGLAAVSGSMIAMQDWWGAQLGFRDIGHPAAVFHYGYSAALAFGTIYWHVRVRPSGAFLNMDWAAADLVALTVVGGAVLGAASPPGDIATTWVLVPPVVLLAWWSILLPTLGWLWYPVAKMRIRRRP